MYSTKYASGINNNYAFYIITHGASDTSGDYTMTVPNLSCNDYSTVKFSIFHLRTASEKVVKCENQSITSAAAIFAAKNGATGVTFTPAITSSGFDLSSYEKS